MIRQATILLCDCLVAITLSWLLNWVGLFAIRGAHHLHWTERARKLWPLRIGAGSSLWLLPIDLILAQRLLWQSEAPAWQLTALVGFLGAWIGNYSFHRKIFNWLTPRSWLDQLLTTVAFRFSWWFLLALIISIMPPDFGWPAFLLFAIYPLLTVLWVAGGFAWLLSRLGVMVPAPESLVLLVGSVSRRSNIRFRRVWMLKSLGSAAFALPYTGDLLFSERLLKLHPDDEIGAICGHELGHLSESKIVLARRLLGSMALAPCLFARPIFYTWGPSGVLFVFAGGWLLFWGARQLSQRLEARADQIGQANESDAGAYARALSRLHEDNLIPAVMPRKTTHPDLYDRLLSIGTTPDYPRPQKPSTLCLQTFVLAVPCGVLVALTLISLLTSATKEPPAPIAMNEFCLRWLRV